MSESKGSEKAFLSVYIEGEPKPFIYEIKKKAAVTDDGSLVYDMRAEDVARERAVEILAADVFRHGNDDDGSHIFYPSSSIEKIIVVPA